MKEDKKSSMIPFLASLSLRESIMKMAESISMTNSLLEIPEETAIKIGTIFSSFDSLLLEAYITKFQKRLSIKDFTPEEIEDFTNLEFLEEINKTNEKMCKLFNEHFFKEEEPSKKLSSEEEINEFLDNLIDGKD